MTSYLAGFALLDFYFVMEEFTEITRDWDRELIGFVFCCVLAGVSLMLSLTILVMSILDSYKHMKSMLE